MATKRIEERKAQDREARRLRIVQAARQIAEAEGWPNVTVRRLSDEISYSQPVLYSHFENRDAIVSAVAVEGFQEMGAALEVARLHIKRGNAIEAVANAYMRFATDSPALYEAMFSLSLTVPFNDPATPPELLFAFAQVLALFPERRASSAVSAELLWASLHGIAELTRTKRFPPRHQRARLERLVQVFHSLVE